jgi:hypothetical protein
MSDGAANGNPSFWIKLGHSGGGGGEFFVRDEAASGDPDRLIVALQEWTDYSDTVGLYTTEFDTHAAHGPLLIISGYRPPSNDELGWIDEPIYVHGGDTHLFSYWPDTTFRVSHTWVAFEFGNPSYFEDPATEAMAHVSFKAWNAADGYLSVMTDLDQFGTWTYRNVGGAERILLEPENYNADSALTLGSTTDTRGYLLVRAARIGDKRPGVIVLEGADGVWAYLWLCTSGGNYQIRASLGDPGIADATGVLVAQL